VPVKLIRLYTGMRRNVILPGPKSAQIMVAMASSINEDWAYLKNRVLYRWVLGRIALVVTFERTKEESKMKIPNIR